MEKTNICGLLSMCPIRREMLSHVLTLPGSKSRWQEQAIINYLFHLYHVPDTGESEILNHLYGIAPKKHTREDGDNKPWDSEALPLAKDQPGIKPLC